MTPLLTGRHVMVDLETFGLGKSSVFFQVGACEFFPEEDRIGETFNRYIDFGSSLQAGRTIDPRVILYWMGHESDGARQRHVAGLTRDPPSFVQVLQELTDFCQVSNGRRGLGQRREGAEGVWSHGPAFDAAILEDGYASLGLKTPWHHRDVLDTRTIFRLSGFSLSRFCGEEMAPLWPQTAAAHVAHDGESDAIAQALAVMVAVRRLRREA